MLLIITAETYILIEKIKQEKITNTQGTLIKRALESSKTHLLKC